MCSLWKLRENCFKRVYSNSRNDVPRVAQRYGTIAAHTRRRESVLVVYVAFCVHVYSVAGLIRRTPPPTFSDTAITDRHSDTTISSSELTGCGYPGLLDRKNRSDMCPRWESNPRLPACYPLGQALRSTVSNVCVCIPILVTTFPEWLSGTEPLPHTPGAVRPSSLCL